MSTQTVSASAGIQLNVVDGAVVSTDASQQGFEPSSLSVRCLHVLCVPVWVSSGCAGALLEFSAD